MACLLFFYLRMAHISFSWMNLSSFTNNLFIFCISGHSVRGMTSRLAWAPCGSWVLIQIISSLSNNQIPVQTDPNTLQKCTTYTIRYVNRYTYTNFVMILFCFILRQINISAWSSKGESIFWMRLLDWTEVNKT